ncbi:putative baseplate assembly protein [Paenibacillus montanisoli]|uniref:Putative baseplate assembly protein n=1 Tax=Paenibacillus montanisoli TaxID=2081970 RepID=A0A328U6W3_9BACL|nr:putative baseplate assembly protein [Paenibacillus montanisoli]RAP78309.1 putative baseplate assembly protein [Paenibacillus montanisoli]
MIYFCNNQRRRGVISNHPEFNGIDFLEVVDDPGMSIAQRQRTLTVHFINSLTVSLSERNFLITGGERIKHITVTDVKPGVDNTVLEIRVSEPGDFSTYTLFLVHDAGRLQPPSGFDALLSSVDFSFKIECANDFDCQQSITCPPKIQQEPIIDYLAKDYASFRRTIMDRLALLMPQWQESHPADMGIALVELLCYVGDYLSYQQDAIANEAYPGTARRRISMRRHARLVDYPMHDGCNARVWVQIQVSNNLILPIQTQLLTRISSQEKQPLLLMASSEYKQALSQGAEVFETMEEARVFTAHNMLSFYTWGDRECCLPAGSTRATLLGKLPNLQVGDLLIFQEKLGPNTGIAGDANPAHRCVVRLTGVMTNNDPLGGLFLTPPSSDPIDITEITWAEADALPFALCLSARTDAEHGNKYVTDVSVALGNVILADHGRTVTQSLGYVPPAQIARAQPTDLTCQSEELVLAPPLFRPQLQQGALTQRGRVKRITSTGGSVLSAGRRHHQVLYFDPQAPASAAMQWDLGLAVPAISVTDSSGARWNVQRDLLASDGFDKHFLAEVEDNGLATLRFGDGIYGMQPRPDTDQSKPGWLATYRIGNGTAGNVGACTLTHIVSNDPSIIAVTNPLPAQGGIDPESMEHVRLSAPVAFNSQERAVILADYAAAAQRYPGVQRAVATYRWTGSWRTVFLSIDRLAGLEVDDSFKSEMLQFLERFRMEGQDIEINAPRYVPLEIAMKVCVKDGYFWSDVKQALIAVFSNRLLPDGRRGLFHADNFTFGQDVYLSPLFAAAQAVPGVSFVEITSFQRLGQPATDASGAEVLKIGALEVARLDNDRNFPEHGIFHIEER